MSLLFRSARALGDPGQPMLPGRSGSPVGAAVVNGDTALTQSAVWAALRLRADLVSSMPVHVYRQANGLRLDIPTPPVLTNPGGPACRLAEWLYSTQIDLDRYGNAFGIIRARDGMGKPSHIELVAARSVTVQVKDGTPTYKIGGETYAAQNVWHEKAYTVPGSVVGLSPIAYAAMSIGRYLSAERFSAEWFSGGQVPKGHLKNTARKVSAADAMVAKARFNRIFETGGVFVSGNDWEYDPIFAESNDMSFLDSMNASTVDIARFIGVPGDMIDAPSQGQSLTYANIGQRNLQFLIMHLGPALRRREDALSSGLLAAGRYVKFDAAGVLLQMDPLTAMNVVSGQIMRRYLTVDEARAGENRPPLTEADYQAFDRLFAKALPEATDPADPADTSDGGTP